MWLELGTISIWMELTSTRYQLAPSVDINKSAKDPHEMAKVVDSVLSHNSSIDSKIQHSKKWFYYENKKYRIREKCSDCILSVFVHTLFSLCALGKMIVLKDLY